MAETPLAVLTEPGQSAAPLLGAWRRPLARKKFRFAGARTASTGFLRRRGDFALRFQATRLIVTDPKHCFPNFNGSDAMDCTGLSVPRPRAALSGKVLECGC